MRTSIFTLGFFAIGLAQCSGDRGLFVGDERAGDAGQAGEPAMGGTGSGRTGGSGGGSNGGSSNAGEGSGGTENTGGSDRGGSGSGAEGGEPSDTGGSGGSDRGGTDGIGGDAMRGGAGGSGAEAGSGTAARGGNDGGRAGSANAGAGGVHDGGRAGSANAGAGGTSDTDCEALGREYLQRLANAQQCSPQLTVEQCTIEMPDDFFCPCKTYVNPMREADIRRLNEILEKRTGCVRLCPAIACPDIKRGVCQAGVIDPITRPTGGRCTGAAM